MCLLFLLRGLHFECQRLAYLHKFNKLLHAYIFPDIATFEHNGYFVYPEFKNVVERVLRFLNIKVWICSKSFST